MAGVQATGLYWLESEGIHLGLDWHHWDAEVPVLCYLGDFLSVNFEMILGEFGLFLPLG